MKKILITGANSYIGTTVQNHLNSFEDRYSVDVIDMIDGSWREYDFSKYDTVYHVAGIAHADTGKVSEERKQMYYKVNSELAIETAKKAKAEGVKQFIFMSSAIVYGDSAPIGKSKLITRYTPIGASNFYGDSKVKAEEGIRPLQDDKFKIVILRPPMIYGKGSKGNYPVLAKMACKLPFFPKASNSRSMLYVGNLAEFVRLMIDNEEKGIFWPQNKEWTNTSKLVQLIARTHGKNIIIVPCLGLALKIMSKFTGLVDKAFGSLTYDQGMSSYKQEYRLYSLEDSIRLTEE